MKHRFQENIEKSIGEVSKRGYDFVNIDVDKLQISRFDKNRLDGVCKYWKDDIEVVMKDNHVHIVWLSGVYERLLYKYHDIDKEVSIGKDPYNNKWYNTY